jgi:hypothetical protein
VNNYKWPRLGRKKLNFWLIKLWLDCGHLKLEKIYILIISIDKFYDWFPERKNVEFGFRVYCGWEKLKVEFDKQKVQGFHSWVKTKRKK